MTILEADKFVGRNDELDDLYAEVVAQRCVSIVGTRRIGKSSLLHCMGLPEIQQRFAAIYDLHAYLPIFIDLGEHLSSTTDEFFDTVSAQLIAQSAARASLEKSAEVSSSETFCQLLDQLQEQGLRVVLLFDAFHKITSNVHFDPKFFSFLRAQANHGRVAYVTASVRSLDQCCHPYIEGSPFFNIFNVYRLRGLRADEARQLITEPAAAAGLPFSTDDVEQILHLAGRHPFFIQRCAFLLFKAKQHKFQGYAWLKQEAYQDLLPNFQDIWEHSLDAGQREQLREEVYWQAVGQRKLPELSESALFRKFVQTTCDIQPLEITVEYLEEVLGELGNTKFLGECALTHLYLFSVRSRKTVTPQTVNEKGTVVRKILQEARDKLRPGGEQSDLAAEWQSFNILNYRYFIEHKKHEVLADMMGISVRQLHRKRHQAIELLRDTLNDMEITAREDAM